MSNKKKTKYQSVLLIRIDRLGDLILSLPAVLVIHENSITLDMIAQKNFAPFLEQSGLLSRVIPYSPRQLIKVIISLLTKEYDLAIDLTPASTYLSSFFLFLSRAKEKAGYAVGVRKFFLTKPIIPPNVLIYERDMVLEICHKLDIPIKNRTLFFPVSKTNYQDSKKKINDTLQHTGLDNQVKRNKIVAVHVGASRPEKCWETREFIDLLNRLLEDDPSLCFVFIGTGNEINKSTEINNALTQKQTIFVDKFSLLELGIFLSQCQLLICSNSGPMNVGAAVGVPMVVINLVSSEERWAPRGDHVRVVSTSTQDFELLHREKEQLKAHISPDEVYNACKDLLKKSNDLNHVEKTILFYK